MFDFTQIFAAISNFFSWWTKLWEKQKEDEKKRLFERLEQIKLQLEKETDETKINQLLEEKSKIKRKLEAIK
jgi:DNA-binding transcriptional regulator GbsR (MarR family)